MSEFNPSPDFEEKVRKAMAVSEPSREFINRLHADLVALPVKRQNRLMFRPVWAIAVVVAVIIVVILSAPTVVTAFERLFGYVPNVGLVENTGSLRVLSEPVSITRDGVTLTITDVYVYEDRVEVIYEVSGITPSNDGWQAGDAQENPTAFCGGVEIGQPMSRDGDARLKLPDGTVLERDYTGRYPQNAFAMKPVYQASVPAAVNRMTLVLKCLRQARLGAVPENWEVPFDLKTVPAGEVVGEPVVKVESTPVVPTALPGPVATEESKVPSPSVTMELKKIVPGSDRYVFFFTMDAENPDPSLISIMPVNVYVVDSLGQKIQLTGNFPWQPFEHRVGSEFQFTSQSKPADGPLTLVVENAVSYYAPL